MVQGDRQHSTNLQQRTRDCEGRAALGRTARTSGASHDAAPRHQARAAHPLNLVDVLVDQWIGLEETDDGVWSICFTTVRLATLDERDFLIPSSRGNTEQLIEVPDIADRPHVTRVLADTVATIG